MNNFNLKKYIFILICNYLKNWFNLFRGVELSQCAVLLILQVICSLLSFSESFSELLYLLLNLPLSLMEAAAYKAFFSSKVSKLVSNAVIVIVIM